MRYGDDFIILADNAVELGKIRINVIEFLKHDLRLDINCRHDIIIKANRGLKFLGVVIYPWNRWLSRRNNKRLRLRINLGNLSSYSGLIKQYEPDKLTEINYLAKELLNDI